MSLQESGAITGTTNYTFIRKIASGGMGSVYEAEQSGAQNFTKRLAIKTILPKYSKNREFVTMFIGEAKLVANLIHPNIVQIYQLGEYDSGYYISMEYIDGINLEQFMNRHKEMATKVPLEIATFIVSRICRGLEYAHNKCDGDGNNLAIVHRDVSPKNVMLTSEGECKLTDFGVAKAAGYMRQEEGEVLMGKVEYMSPEQASYKITDCRSDLFSLGICYYELLTGENVFEQDDVFETLERVKEGEIPDPREYRSDIPEDVAQIVMKTLIRDLDERYQSGDELGSALEHHMYDDGFGPTIQTLARYLAKIYPERHFSGVTQAPSAVDTMADTERQTNWDEEPTIV